MTIRIGWYTTRGRSSRAMFEAVLAAIRAGDLDAQVAYVFSNRDPGDDPVTDAFFDLVQSEGIPLLTLGSIAYRKAHGGERSKPGEPLPSWRVQYDAEVARLIEPYPTDLGVLAGYLLIFTEEFANTHPMVNLHPALPGGPIGTYIEVIHQLIRGGASESGVMLNVAIPEVDMGPVAAFCRYPLRGEGFDAAWAALDPAALEPGAGDEMLEASPLFEAIRAAQVRHEAPFLAAALQAFADGRLRLEDLGESAPLDLTEDVQRRLGAA